MTENFNIETFIGLHIYLVAADLIYNILDRFITCIYDNLLSPLVNVLLGDTVSSFRWKIGKDEDDVIDLGKIVKESVKLFIIALMSFYMYKYFKKYKKYKDLKYGSK